MQRWALVLCAGFFGTMSGCCVVVENTDPFGDPVTLAWSRDPLDQPNYGTLNSGFFAEFNFQPVTTQLTLKGFDTVAANFNDTISISVPRMPQCRYVEWDGFLLIDRGVATPLTLARLASKEVARLFEPGDEGIVSGDPNKTAVAP